jgi:hypothetical protein
MNDIFQIYNLNSKFKLPKNLIQKICFSKFDCFINKIYNSNEFRKYLHNKYYLDYTQIRDIFCNPIDKKLIQNYYIYLNKFYPEKESDDIEFINNYSNDMSLKNYFEKSKKYNNLINMFTNRTFINEYYKLNYDDFKVLFILN